ncbi:MAG: hypothetical protein KDD43_10370 [Bdellovibrionales bacterium]|nr:hypothetical protein [Bdellovibrionales bacterium]
MDASNWATMAFYLAIAILLGCEPMHVRSLQENGFNGSSGSGSGSGGGGSGGGSSVPAEQAFFTERVRTSFESSCVSCHAAPRLVTGTPAPLNIYDYGPMKNLLNDGASPANNRLINKIRGVITHTGGDACGGNLSSGPCKEVMEWYKVENKVTDNGSTGFIDNISPLGVVTGWSKDPGDENKKLTVYFYVNGPVGVGQAAGSVVAQEVGLGGAGLNHYFNHQLPAQFRDGTPRDVYVYSEQAVAGNLLPGSPRQFVAYQQTQEGRQYFAANIANNFANTCGACHPTTYEAGFANLISPPPDKGGTAQSNGLVIKGSGGGAHGGGNRCGGTNGSPCREFQEWWRIEFGN